MPYKRDTKTEKIHPTQKSVDVLSNLIQLFTDTGEVVIDPCAGSGSTLIAAVSLNRRAYGFEIKKEFVQKFNTILKTQIQGKLFNF